MPRHRILHKLKHRPMPQHKHHPQRIRSIERPEQDLCIPQLVLETLNTKSDMRQISDRTMHRTIRLEAQKLDAMRMSRGIGYPHLRRFYIHLACLLIGGWNSYMIEHTHILTE